jgi:hypothetical protein
MQMFRLISGNIIRDKLKNDFIRNRVEVVSIEDNIKK